MDIEKLAKRIKAEVLKDFKDGTVPRDKVKCFKDLHDYTDANMYGFVEGTVVDEEYIEALNKAQDIVEAEVFAMEMFAAAYKKAKVWGELDKAVELLHGNERKKLYKAMKLVKEATGLDMRQDFLFGVLRSLTEG